MLQLSGSLLNVPVLSLRTGGPLATTSRPIINPNNLKIEGFWCHDRFEKANLILLTQEIRDILPQGIAVNDHDALTDPTELVRLKDILDLNFELMGKPVVTVSKHRLGKVNDFAADDQTLYIQKLYVGQSILKSISTGQLSIERTNIVEITNKKIIVQEILKPRKAGLPVSVPST
jgi:sporulation protein YlmC with PRC-barrel domain